MMRKFYVIASVLIATLFFSSCDQGTTVAEGGMYPPVPGYAEVLPYGDGTGLVRVTIYAADGVILEQGDYLDNLREGIYTTFHNTGLIKSTCGYVGGLKQGQEITFDDRQNVENRATYHQGELNGAYVTYMRNRIKEKKNYLEGELNGELMKFYPNGVLMESSFYKNGQLDGVANWYDQEGNMTIEYVYRKGERVEKEE